MNKGIVKSSIKSRSNSQYIFLFFQQFHRGRIIIWGNIRKTAHLSKSVSKQHIALSNLATNKNISYRNNAVNSKIQKHHHHYQVILTVTSYCWNPSLLLRTMCQMCNTKKIVWPRTVLPPKCLVIERITNRKNEAKASVTKSVIDK